MSHHAHGTNRSYGHATRPMPTLPVRTVQERRHTAGWLDCPADEFMRLLALHNAGEINLLEMPETAADVVDEPPEEEADEQSAIPRRFGAVNRDMGSAGRVVNLLSQAALTVQEITQKTGLTASAVRTVLHRNPQWFVCVGVEDHAKRWKRVVHKQEVMEGG